MGGVVETCTLILVVLEFRFGDDLVGDVFGDPLVV
jgi:hypothetical protein